MSAPASNSHQTNVLFFNGRGAPATRGACQDVQLFDVDEHGASLVYNCGAMNDEPDDETEIYGNWIAPGTMHIFETTARGSPKFLRTTSRPPPGTAGPITKAQLMTNGEPAAVVTFGQFAMRVHGPTQDHHRSDPSRARWHLVRQRFVGSTRNARAGGRPSTVPRVVRHMTRAKAVVI